MAKGTSVIRKVFLYLVTAISIVLILISTIGLINLALKEYVFDVKGWEEFDKYWECENGEREVLVEGIVDSEVEVMSEEEKEACIAEAKEKRELRHMNDVKRNFVWLLSMLIVASPMYLYHWGVIKKEK